MRGQYILSLQSFSVNSLFYAIMVIVSLFYSAPNSKPPPCRPLQCFGFTSYITEELVTTFLFSPTVNIIPLTSVPISLVEDKELSLNNHLTAILPPIFYSPFLLASPALGCCLTPFITAPLH